MGLCRSGGKKGANKNKLRPIGYKKPKVDLKKVTWQQMQAIPETEDDLIPVPIYINIFKKLIVDEEIKATDIRTPALREIFIGDEENAIQLINAQQRENKWIGGFQFDLLAAFWLSMHYGRIKVLNHMIQYDIYLRQLVTLALKGKPERPRKYAPPRKIRNLKMFDKTAGLTSETLHLANIVADDTSRHSKRDSKRESQNSKNSPRPPTKIPAGEMLFDNDNSLPAIKKNSNVQPFQEELPFNQSGPNPGFIEQKFGDPKDGGNGQNAQNIPVKRQLNLDQQLEGGSQEEFDEFREDQKADSERHDSHHGTDESYDDGEDDGEGSDSGSRDSKSCGSREPNEEFEKAQMGGMFLSPEELRRKADEMTTMNSDGFSGINIGDPDDSQNIYQTTGNKMKPPQITMSDEKSQDYLIERGISGLDIEMMEMETAEQCEHLKKMCRIYFPTLMANIAQILLYKDEQKLACLLAAYYEMSLEDEAIMHAASNKKNFDWLKYVWAFGKNYTGSRRQGDAVKITIKALIQIICTVYQNDPIREEECCEKVCQWYLAGGQEEEYNILKALLSQNQQKIALKYMGYYMKFLDRALFIYALAKNSNYFMQEALKKQAFEKEMYQDPKVVNSILTFFENDGSMTNFILNVLLLTDIAQWKPQSLTQLLSIFEEYTETDQLLLSYNPLMSIALTCDLLNKIGTSRKAFRDQCVELSESLLELGEIYSSKVEDEEHYKELINDTDFNGRTVLNIICYSQFQQLMSEDDPKASNLIRDIWQGEEFTKCDGNIFGFSNMTSILLTRAKRADAQAQFKDIITGGFKMVDTVDYTFQLRYRSYAISHYFLKEILLAFGMAMTFATINGNYRTFFMGPRAYVGMVADKETGEETLQITESQGMYDFEEYDPEPQITDIVQREELMKTKLEEFSKWYPIILFLCGSLCYSVVLKLLFNALQKPDNNQNSEDNTSNKVLIDKWTKLDLISAVATLICFPLILQASPTDLIDPDKKSILDYIILMLHLLQWTRFYMFFLMISELSKMLLTFIAMVIDTIAFMFLVGAYLIIVSAIFTTMFQDTNSAYEAFGDSLRTMFDGLMASYSYKGFGDKEMTHTIMLILHILISNILMLNYLIAILSDSYTLMLDKGKFLYKVYLYQYCERYIVGLKDKELGQLVLHPAPICSLNFPLVLFFCIPYVPSGARKACSEFFAIFMFWLENVIWLAGFMVYEIAISPLVYIKNLFVVAWATPGLFLPIWYTVAWLFTGPIMLIYLVLRDMYQMFLILSYHKGCRFFKGMAEELPQTKIDTNEYVQRFNEAREIAIQKYLDIKKEINDDDEEDKQINVSEIQILNMLDEDKDLYDENKEKFVVKASTLVSDWQKMEAVKMKQDDVEPESKKPDQQQKEQDPDEIKRREKEEEEKKAAMGSKSGQLNEHFQSKVGGMTSDIKARYISTIVEHEQNDQNDDEQEQEEQKEDEQAEEEEDEYQPDTKTEEIIEKFFNFFLINAEGSATNDNVDIVLLLRATPNKVNSLTLQQIQKFRFLILQDAIDAHKNSDRVTSFEFYDKKNKTRVNTVKSQVQQQMQNLMKIESNLQVVKNELNSKEELMNEYEALSRQWNEEKHKNANSMIDDEIKEQLETKSHKDNEGKQVKDKKAAGKKKKGK